MSISNRHRKLRDAILAFAERSQEEMSIRRLLAPEMFRFVRDDANAFLFGLIADQSVRAEIAWSLPYRLRERLGHFDVTRIAPLKLEEMGRILAQKPALHRYPNTVGKNLVFAAQMLTATYKANARGIWAPPATAPQVIERLKEFSGIGHKKASLGLILLIRNFGLKLADTSAIDIANDLHIRRIFLRTGLTSVDSAEAILAAARTLNPVYPGLLTTPVWVIGRTWCKASSPDCGACPLSAACEKLLLLTNSDE